MLLSYGIVPVWRLKYNEKCIEIETMYLFHILGNKLNLYGICNDPQHALKM